MEQELAIELGKAYVQVRESSWAVVRVCSYLFGGEVYQLRVCYGGVCDLEKNSQGSGTIFALPGEVGVKSPDWLLHCRTRAGGQSEAEAGVLPAWQYGIGLGAFELGQGHAGGGCKGEELIKRSALDHDVVFGVDNAEGRDAYLSTSFGHILRP